MGNHLEPGPYATWGPEPDRRILHWTKVAMQEAIPNSVIENAKFELDDHMMVGALVARLSSYVLTDHILSRTQWVTLEVPSSWWQHFKRDVLPKWLYRRWPVKTCELRGSVTFNEDKNYVNYPYIPEETFGHPVIVETVSKSPWRDSHE